MNSVPSESQRTEIPSTQLHPQEVEVGGARRHGGVKMETAVLEQQ